METYGTYGTERKNIKILRTIVNKSNIYFLRKLIHVRAEL